MKKLLVALVALFFVAGTACATNFTDLQFGAAQLSDTQWNVSACTTTATCQIYSLSGIGATYNTGSRVNLSAGQYIQFASSGNASYPWTMNLYNSDGTLNRSLGNGKLYVEGTGNGLSGLIPGKHFFFFSNASYNGTLFSTDYGFASNPGQFSFTGDASPTVAQTNTFAATGSTTPLAAGQSGGNNQIAPPPAPTVTGTSTTNTVTTSTSTGPTTTATTSSLGTPTTAVTVDNARRAQSSQALTIRQTTTSTTTTPITYTTVATTPVTTTTTTTPVTTTTYSDNTTTVSTGTPVVTTSTTNSIVTTTSSDTQSSVATAYQDFDTRIDMYNRLSTVNSQINSAFVSDPLNRTRIDNGVISLRNGNKTDVYLIGTGMRTNTVDGYQTTSSLFGVGADYIVNQNFLYGWQYAHANATMSGDGTAGGGLSKDLFGVYGIKSVQDWLIKFDIGSSFNNYSAYHTLPALGYGNSGSGKGSDYFAQTRLYTPDMRAIQTKLGGLRLFVGQAYQHNSINPIAESGTVLTAMTYDPVNTQTWATETGVAHTLQLTQDWNIVTELSRNNRDQNTEIVSVSYRTTWDSSVSIKAFSQQTNNTVNNGVQAWARITF